MWRSRALRAVILLVGLTLWPASCGTDEHGPTGGVGDIGASSPVRPLSSLSPAESSGVATSVTSRVGEPGQSAGTGPKGSSPGTVVPGTGPNSSAPCTIDAVRDALTAANLELTEPPRFACESAWAYSYAKVPKENSAPAAVSILQANGPRWAVVDKATACTGPPVAPSVRQVACSGY